MIKWIITTCLLIVYGSTYAHSPDISSMVLMEQENGQWALQIRAPLTGLEYEIHHHYGKESFATAEEFQGLVLEYIKDQVSIQANGEELKLKNGMVKLGHESIVIYQIAEMPESIRDLTISNSAFQDINRNQMSLMIYKNGFKENQFVLNNANNHKVALEIDRSKFIRKEQTLAEVQNPKWYVMSFTVFALGLVTYLKLKAG